ncbi:MAG: hypothetical protein ACYCOU_00390 [Sulfobacillus sp.]
MVKAVCPLCGSNGDFGENDIIPGIAHLLVNVDEAGEVQVQYAGETMVFWDDQRVNPSVADTPYRCLKCDGSFAAFKVVEA